MATFARRGHVNSPPEGHSTQSRGLRTRANRARGRIGPSSKSKKARRNHRTELFVFAPLKVHAFTFPREGSLAAQNLPQGLWSTASARSHAAGSRHSACGNDTCSAAHRSLEFLRFQKRVPGNCRGLPFGDVSNGHPHEKNRRARNKSTRVLRGVGRASATCLTRHGVSMGYVKEDLWILYSGSLIFPKGLSRAKCLISHFASKRGTL